MPLGGQMQVNHGGGQTAVAQILLDAPDVDTCFEQMGGVAVAKGVDGDTFCDGQRGQCLSQGTPDGIAPHGFFCC